MDSVKINLDVATRAAEIALRNIRKETEEANKTFNIFKGNFAAGLAVNALQSAFSLVNGSFSSMIEEAQNGENAIQKLNTALNQAGLYSEANVESLLKFSAELQQVSVHGDDATQSAAAYLLQLTNLDIDGVQNLLKSAADLSAVLGIDLQSATELLGKAVNGNVSSLQRYGFEIEKGSNTAENLTNVLKGLEKIQGSAAAKTQTYAGAMEQFKNANGDVLESLGQLITQNKSLVGFLTVSTQAFLRLSEFISRNASDIVLLAKSFAASVLAVGAASLAMKAYTLVLGTTTGAFTILSAAANATWVAISGPIGKIVASVTVLGVAIYGLVKYWNEVQIATLEAAVTAKEFAASAASYVSSGWAKGLKADAQALREYADEVRIAQVAELEAQNSKSVEGTGGVDEGERERQARLLEELKANQAKKLEIERGFRTQKLLEEQSHELSLQDQKAAHEQAMYNISGQYDAETTAKFFEVEQERLLARQEFERAELAAKAEAERQKALLIEDSEKRQLALKEANAKAKIESVKLGNKQELESLKLRNKTEEQLSANRIANQRSTMSTIAGLSNSNNKLLASIGKAAGIAQIAIDTPVAISKALASAPPPFNFALAALVGTAMAAQSAQLAGLNFETGGIVPGTSYTGDKVAANVNSREMILTTQQQAELFKIANGKASKNSDSNSETNMLLGAILSAVKSGTSIQIEGKEIINVVRNGLSSGRSLA